VIDISWEIRTSKDNKDYMFMLRIHDQQSLQLDAINRKICVHAFDIRTYVM